MLRTAFSLLLGVLLAVTAGAVQAQLGLPALPPLPAGLDRAVTPVLDSAEARLDDLRDLRPLQIRGLLRQHRDQIDTDFDGEPVVRHEILLLDVDESRISRLQAAGFEVLRQVEIGALDISSVVLRAPRRLNTRQAMRRLRRLEPEARFEFNHVYLGSGFATSVVVAPSGESGRHASNAATTIGLIDSGVDPAHPSLAAIEVHRWGCDQRAHPASHGTAVASLLVGDAAGAMPEGTRLYAADIYCGEAEGGAVTRLVHAMAWLAEQGTRVINVSLVGADNRLLRQAIAAMQARGHLIVAAVGNDGPSAPPLFPAAYPGVVGVTAVDARQRVIPEALRGDQVMFAAPGAYLRAAAPVPGLWQTVRGTSFAAPLVARLAATTWQPHDTTEAVLSRLRTQAIDLGDRGRDRRFGDGLLGTTLPVHVEPKR